VIHVQKDLNVALHVNKNSRKRLNTFMLIKALLMDCEVNVNLAGRRNPGDHRMSVLVRTLGDDNTFIGWNTLMLYGGINIVMRILNVDRTRRGRIV
jgi:hypothetical protein